MREENVTYELEDKDGCPNCHHQVSLWLGFSGVDNEGVHLAYRCPQCGFETCDYLPSVDDVVPNTIAWRREPDGVITWYPEVRAEQSVQSDVCHECGETETIDPYNDGVPVCVFCGTRR